MEDYGLQQLFNEKNYLGPALRSAEQWGVEQASRQADESRKAAELERYKMMTPLELEKTTLANRKAATEATKGERTLESDVSAAIAGNEEKVLSSKLKAVDTMSQALGGISATLEGVPPAARHAQLLQLAQGMGVNPQDPKIAPVLQTLSKVPGDQLPAALLKFRQRVVEQGAAYRQAMDIAIMNRQSQEKEGAANRANQQLLEQMRIDAGKYKGKQASGIMDQVKSGKLSYEKAATAFEVMAASEEDETLRQQYTDLAQRFGQEAIRLRGAGQPGKPDIEKATGGAVPTLKPTTGLGGGATPKLGTRENPIKLD